MGKSEYVISLRSGDKIIVEIDDFNEFCDKLKKTDYLYRPIKKYNILIAGIDIIAVYPVQNQSAFKYS
jgi:hypothetical protein